MTDPYAKTEAMAASGSHADRTLIDVLSGEVRRLRQKMDTVEVELGGLRGDVKSIGDSASKVRWITGLGISFGSALLIALMTIFYTMRTDDTALLRENRDTAIRTEAAVEALKERVTDDLGDHERRLGHLEAAQRFGD